MKRHFVFRLDGSKDNDEYFAKSRSRGDVVAYSGMAMLVGPGWIPDLVEIEVLDDGSRFTITLVELEAQEITARASCRKYLAESSETILSRFLEYLQGVSKQCQATADPRLDDFTALHSALSGAASVEVVTAGALRTATGYIECHALLDQPSRRSITNNTAPVDAPAFEFDGVTTFSREAKHGLRRTVRVLHAVIAGHDHSDGTMHSWRNSRRKPLDAAVLANTHNYPALHQLLEHKLAAGMRLDCAALASELAALWSNPGGRRFTAEAIGEMIRSFAPTCIGFSEQDSMRDVFAAANTVVHEHAI